ncbi:hypothetical protein QU487_20600 [Crenobacter sp. SG2305]|uniref:hypothetical protein n=1 Tax=Crenobacter oryzisoli TaxID=3056844 RepID=UPI0025AA88E4|nr:hypothetical protein [Crenobacter sp. SG2305]MDN0085112.1 hypothetical protein [Crenobacter sp. SG2305]
MVAALYASHFILIYPYGIFSIRMPLFNPADSTSHAITLEGVVFPAGSKVEFQKESLWTEHPVSAVAPHPINAGSLRIRSLDKQRDSTLSVGLATAQSIEGWTCSAAQPAYFSVGRGANGGPSTWRLSSCRLIDGVRQAGSSWPAGTIVSRTIENSIEKWLVSWPGNSASPETWCNETLTVDGYKLSSFFGSYDKQHRLETWDGTACRRRANGQDDYVRIEKLGPHRFKETKVSAVD